MATWKICPVCEQEFEAARKSAQFCSPVCRVKAYRSRAGQASELPDAGLSLQERLCEAEETLSWIIPQFQVLTRRVGELEGWKAQFVQGLAKAGAMGATDGPSQELNSRAERRRAAKASKKLL